MESKRHSVMEEIETVNKFFGDESDDDIKLIENKKTKDTQGSILLSNQSKQFIVKKGDKVALKANLKYSVKL